VTGHPNVVDASKPKKITSNDIIAGNGKDWLLEIIVLD
jgi:hypothetical protein